MLGFESSGGRLLSSGTAIVALTALSLAACGDKPSAEPTTPGTASASEQQMTPGDNDNKALLQEIYNTADLIQPCKRNQMPKHVKEHLAAAKAKGTKTLRNDEKSLVLDSTKVIVESAREELQEITTPPGTKFGPEDPEDNIVVNIQSQASDGDEQSAFFTFAKNPKGKVCRTSLTVVRTNNSEIEYSYMIGRKVSAKITESLTGEPNIYSATNAFAISAAAALILNQAVFGDNGPRTVAA